MHLHQKLVLLCSRGTSRFGELQKELPQISKTMLSSVPKKLAEHGPMTRRQFDEMPPHVEYSLTEAGRGLMRTFHELCRWELEYFG